MKEEKKFVELVQCVGIRLFTIPLVPALYNLKVKSLASCNSIVPVGLRLYIP